MKPFRILCGALCLIAPATVLSQISSGALPEDEGEFPVFDHWTTMTSPDAGFRLPVPPGVRAQDISRGADWAKFASEDGEFVMTARGGPCTESVAETVDAHWRLAMGKPGRTVDHQRKTASGFAITGEDRNGSIFYQKFLVKGEQTATVTITYPRYRARDFYVWVTSIDSRFTLGAESAMIATTPSPAPVSTTEFRTQGNWSGAASTVTSFSTPAPRDVPVTRSFELEARNDALRVLDTTTRQPLGSSLARASREPVSLDSPPVLEQETGITNVEPERISTPAPSLTKPLPADLPFGVPVAGKPGFVYSPFGEKKLVDVSGFPRGKKVKCPYTKEVFLVP